MALPNFLSPISINLVDILLDPNNPRFAELGEPFEPDPEARFAEERVQREAFEKMKSGNFDVAELRDTIKTLGFLPMDRIVVRRWRSGPAGVIKYIIVEGNRRTAALKWLVELHTTARETFLPEQMRNFTELQVLLLDDEHAPDSTRWILPGLRHVSGIKEWGPYQKARTVHQLRESGTPQRKLHKAWYFQTCTGNQLW